MRRIISLVLFALAAAPAGPAHAQLNAWRTQVQVSNGSGNSTQIQSEGGLNDPYSFLELARGSSALSRAESSLSPSGFTPTLRTRAVASPTRAQAVAWGVQGYTNTSGQPLSTALQMNLDAQVTGSNDLDARMYLFQDGNFTFSTDPGTILFETSSQLWPGFEAFANNPGPTGFDVLFGNHTGPINETRQFDFTVDPGDSFYVWSMLLATADNPGTVDAFGTLTASFTNTDGLTPAAVVPDPSTLPLAAPLLLAALGRRVGR